MQDFTVKYWLEKGLDRKKLILGMPMYGQSFTLSDASDNGLQSKTYGGGEAGKATRARGFLAYYEVPQKNEITVKANSNFILLYRFARR